VNDKVDPAQVHLRALSYTEQLSLDSYKTAVESSIADATAFGDKVVTAAIAVASAYGAVIALVAPKDEPSGFAVVPPFVAFAAAAAFALAAQGVGIATPDSNDLEKIDKTVKSTIDTKRNLGIVALLALVVGLIWAGIVVHDSYGNPADTSTSATIWLTDSGKELVTGTCGGAPTDTLAGKVTDAASLGGKRVAVEVDKTACPNGAGTIVLPQSAIETALLAG
jgi:hypothetical protein